jgi:hypothetical protein
MQKRHTKQVLNKLVTEETHFKIAKMTFHKLKANFILNVEKLKSFFVSPGAREQRHSPLLFYIVLQVLVRTIRPEKERKCIQLEKKKRCQIVTVSDDISETPKIPPKPIGSNKFRKVTEIEWKIKFNSVAICQ